MENRTDDSASAPETVTDSSTAPPTLRIITPDATPEEIAAIVAVFSAMGASAPAAKKPVASWAAPARRVRAAHLPGRGGWRTSGLPR